MSTTPYVIPAYYFLADDLKSAANKLRGTAESAAFPGTLGDDLVRCGMSLSCSSFLPKLAEKRESLMEEGRALLARYSSFMAARAKI